ncbi:xanthine dehydrogenase family protein molybdopterin-binding subunit [Gemmobacter sp.]|uniref:xanthine dehydrogenase family protein molybdopterin-binding subunit n=1 Tax=Gemmobacter sp. TaxID=1898957 RepID=UPI002B002344|nr:xanthine dehydrogenase family protein molybdopterin-binding subunit [Gemmobacter sp.]
MKFTGPLPLNHTDALRVIGQPVDRIDGRLKVTGQALYAADRHIPTGPPAHGYVLVSPVARGRLLAMDCTQALAAPGVLAIVTAGNANVPGHGRFNNSRLLAGPMIEHYHQAIGLVVATTLEQARHAAGLIRCQIEPDRVQADLHSHEGDWITPEKVPGGEAGDTSLGDFDAAFDQAPVRLDAWYSTPDQSPAMMEPHASIAHWQDGRVILRTSTQMVNWVKSDLARTLGIAEDRVEVTSPYVGGGFGSKTSLRADALLAVLGAQAAGCAVKVVLPRHLLFNNTQHRGATLQRVRIGADTAGRILAIGHESWSGDLHGKRPEAATLPTRALYSGAHRMTRTRLASLDLPECGPMRAPGEAPGLMALEVAMDELAERLDLDPVAVRLLNDTATDPEHPETPFSARHLAECFRLGAERFGWADRPGRPATRRQGDWWVGYGTAAAFRHNILIPSAARVRLITGGNLVVETDMTDIGTGTYTIMAQTAAEVMGLPLDRVTVLLGHSDFPVSCGSAGQFGANNSTAGVYAACVQLRQMIAQQIGVNSDDIGFADGEAVHGTRRYSLADIAARGELIAEDRIDYGAELSAMQQATFGAHFVEVGVHRVTGEIRVRRMLAVCDAGRILNPKTAASQICGSMVMGVGAALMEHLVPDTARGFFVNHDLAGYEFPVCADIPDQDVIFLGHDDAQSSPMKAKGVGELGLCGVAAAIANAVHNATGIRVREYPVTVDKLLPGLPPVA